ncbi:unnamed protein product [Leptosia nina]|uniref:Ig-like domain-containing protein n=1 Tax=Leptosia nina TaxID=320188 RepID=A0AAV1J2P8_9NEOP
MVKARSSGWTLREREVTRVMSPCVHPRGRDKDRLCSLDLRNVPVTWSSSARSATLHCEVVDWARAQPRRPPPPLDDDHSRPKPYLWTRARDEISSKRVSWNGTLEVARKGGDGEDLYQCGVKHHGAVVLGYPINLRFPFMEKQFSAQPEDVEARIGQPLVVPCRIASGPAASINWLKSGESIKNNNRYFILQNELLIVDVKKEDAGVYRCIASNYVLNKSKASRDGVVTVVPSAESSLSLLSLQHEEVTAPRGGNLILPCPVLGWPRPKLIWELTPHEAGSPTSELESSEEVLLLRNLGPDQVGLYTCSVEGRSDLVKNFNVSYTEAVNITHPPLSKEVKRASTVRFNCTATGTPKPKITWYKDGKPLMLAVRINLRTSADRERIELVISGVTSDDAGVYQCFASNGLSTASQWAELTVTGPGAAAPDSVRCAPSGPNSIALSWNHESNRVFAYSVDVALRDNSGAGNTGQPNMNTEETFSVEKALTPYQFQVRAYLRLPGNKTVASDMSESVVCQGQGG